jgi:hypothetical protein
MGQIENEQIHCFAPRLILSGGQKVRTKSVEHVTHMGRKMEDFGVNEG